MLFRNLGSLTFTDLKILADNDVSEGRAIEFKLDLQLNTAREKKEFLADVSAFANSGGGEIFYGVAEQDSVAKSVDGFKVPSVDNLKLTIENLLATGLEPRGIPLNIVFVDCPSGYKVLLLQIRISLRAPHRVILDGGSKFYARRQGGKYPMDVQELRDAFVEQTLAIQRLREFRSDRLEALRDDAAPFALRSSPLLVAHLVPLEPTEVVEIDVEDREVRDHFRPLGGGGGYPRATFEGIAVASNDDHARSGVRAYSMLFRSGAVEAVAMLRVHQDEQRNFGTKNGLVVSQIEEYLFEAVKNYRPLVIARAGEVPCFMLFTLLGVQGLCLRVGSDIEFHQLDGPYVNRKDSVLFPEYQIPSFKNLSDMHLALKPALDQLWNTFGFARAFSYSASGMYHGVR